MATGSASHPSARNRSSGQPFIIAGLDVPLSAEILGDEFEEWSRAVRWWQTAAATTANELGCRGLLLAPRAPHPVATPGRVAEDGSGGSVLSGAQPSVPEDSSTAAGLELVEFDCPLLSVPWPCVGGQIAYPFLHHRLEIDRLVRGKQSAAYRDGAVPVSLHAITPGLIGATLRRIASERNLPLVANYFPGVAQALEQRAVATFSAWRGSQQGTLKSLLASSGFAPESAPSPWGAELDEEWTELRALWSQLTLASTSLRSSHGRWSSAWGKTLLWLVRQCSGYAADRVVGAMAVRDVLRNLEKLARKLDISWPGPGDLAELDGVDLVVRQLARMCTLSYLRWFYRECDVVVAWGDASDVELRQTLGVDASRIRQVSEAPGPWTAAQLTRSHEEAISANAQSIRQPRVMPLQSHVWSEPIDEEIAQVPFAAISDIHLGDGDPVERAFALAKLYDCLRELKIDAIFYVGDIGELSATAKRYENHQLIFNRVRQDRRVTDGVKLDLLVSKMEIPGLSPTSRRHDSIVEQLRKDALRRGLIPSLNGEPIAVLPGVGANKSCWGDGPVPTLRELAIAGNHDEGLDLSQVLPGCPISPSLVHYSREHGAVFHHGHALGLPVFRRTLEQATSAHEICDTLTRQSLGSELEAAAVVHDAATAGWRLSEGMIDLRRLWKNTMQPTMSKAVCSFRELRLSGSSDERGLKVRFLESLLSPADDRYLAAQLAAAVDSRDSPCWIQVGGHSHLAGIDKVRVMHPRLKFECTKLVVNCGKMHGDPLTCVVARFPEVLIAQWSTREQEWRISMRARLSRTEWEESRDGLAGRHSRPIGGQREMPGGELSFSSACGRLSGSVLCECPTEGDGHITRLKSLYPAYARHGVTRTIVSGPRAYRPDVLDGIAVDLRATGYVLRYDDCGAVRRWSSVAGTLRRRQAVEREARQLAEVIPRFDVLISDYGPTLTRAYQLARQNQPAGNGALPRLFQVSHQAALLSRYREFLPRIPDHRISRMDRWLGQSALDVMGTGQIVGLHYEAYHEDLLPPLIRPDLLRERATFEGDFILVVLRGDLQSIRELIAPVRLKTEWRIYTDRVRSISRLGPGVYAFPRCREAFQRDMLNCRGILADCGFGISSEALHLGLPFVARPVAGHFEQLSNGAALEHISHVGVIYDLKRYESRAILESVFGLLPTPRQPLSRLGLMGPIEPFQGVAERVESRIFGNVSASGQETPHTVRSACCSQPTAPLPSTSRG